MKKIKNNKLQIYQAKNGGIELKFDDKKETIWANQKQIAEIFDVNIPAINKHIKNIFEDGELDNSTISILEIVQNEGKRQVKRKVEFYNLDMIISIGYRVNSTKATQFRIWATKILKQHITKGYTLNKKVLRKKQKEAEKVLKDLQALVKNTKLVGVSDVLELIKTFSNTWFNLETYDKQGFPKSGFTKKKVKISAEELYQEVAVLKAELMKKKEATELFANETKKGKLEGILGNVLQSAFSQEMYPTVEEKAAHLLYFIIKNHPFSDGNKRTGAFVFIWFLEKTKLKSRTKITPETLTALTLLIAESNPKEKEKMIGLILLLLKK